MIRIQYGLFILVAFLGGLIGGFVSTKFLSSEIVFAQIEGMPFKQSQIHAKTVIAEEYFLHNKQQTNSLDSEIPIPRALLTTEPNGNPKLIMQDSNGNPRLSVHLSDREGATVSLLDMNGVKKVLVSEKSLDGDQPLGPAFALLDDNGKIRAQIGVQADTNPFITLSDPREKEKDIGRSIKLCLKEKEEARISLCDSDGNQRAALGIDANNACLSLNDASGETRAELGSTELTFGKDGLLKKTASGEISVEQRPLSSLVLYNKNGNVLWSAP
jgi:hypothetical protein